MSKRRRCHQCKKLFPPKYDTVTVTQTLCSCKCAAVWYATQKGSRKLARLTSKNVGRRSMAEVRFDAGYIEGKKSVNADYEADVFKYSVDEVRKYTPDWTLYLRGGRTVYIEFKGVLDMATRKKMKLVKMDEALRKLGPNPMAQAAPEGR